MARDDTALKMPPLARWLPHRYFYGWNIAVACAIFSFVGAGVGYYGLAVFLEPLKDEHHWSTTAVSGATGLYFSIAGIVAAFIGPRIDRRGPIGFMLAGSIACGITCSLIGFVRNLPELYTVYFVFAIAYGMSASVATYAIMTRWFVRRRAMAMSISSTGVSVGGVVLSPLISRLIDVGGLRLAAPAMGILVVVIAVPVILLVIAWDPALMGLKPDGDPPEAPAASSGLLSDAVQRRQWTIRAARRTLPFWSITIAFLLVFMAQTGYIFHQVSFLEDRLGSRDRAALALSVTAGGSIIARLIVGSFADRVDKRKLTVFFFLLQATATLLIIHTQDVAATWMLTLVFGFTIGNIYMMQSLMVADIFGMVSFAAIFSLANVVGQVGAGGGPFGIGYLHDLTNGYGVPFTVTALLTYVAAVIILFARPVQAPIEMPVESTAGLAVSPGGQ